MQSSLPSLQCIRYYSLPVAGLQCNRYSSLATLQCLRYSSLPGLQCLRQSSCRQGLDYSLAGLQFLRQLSLCTLGDSLARGKQLEWFYSLLIFKSSSVIVQSLEQQRSMSSKQLAQLVDSLTDKATVLEPRLIEFAKRISFFQERMADSAEAEDLHRQVSQFTKFAEELLSQFYVAFRRINIQNSISHVTRACEIFKDCIEFLLTYSKGSAQIIRVLRAGANDQGLCSRCQLERLRATKEEVKKITVVGQTRIYAIEQERQRLQMREKQLYTIQEEIKNQSLDYYLNEESDTFLKKVDQALKLQTATLSKKSSLATEQLLDIRELLNYLNLRFQQILLVKEQKALRNDMSACPPGVVTELLGCVRQYFYDSSEKHLMELFRKSFSLQEQLILSKYRRNLVACSSQTESKKDMIYKLETELDNCSIKVRHLREKNSYLEEELEKAEVRRVQGYQKSLNKEKELNRSIEQLREELIIREIKFGHERSDLVKQAFDLEMRLNQLQAQHAECQRQLKQLLDQKEGQNQEPDQESNTLQVLRAEVVNLAKVIEQKDKLIKRLQAKKVTFHPLKKEKEEPEEQEQEQEQDQEQDQERIDVGVNTNIKYFYGGEQGQEAENSQLSELARTKSQMQGKMSKSKEKESKLEGVRKKRIGLLSKFIKRDGIKLVESQSMINVDGVKVDTPLKESQSRLPGTAKIISKSNFSESQTNLKMARTVQSIVLQSRHQIRQQKRQHTQSEQDRMQSKSNLPEDDIQSYQYLKPPKQKEERKLSKHTVSFARPKSNTLTPVTFLPSHIKAQEHKKSLNRQRVRHSPPQLLTKNLRLFNMHDLDRFFLGASEAFQFENVMIKKTAGSIWRQGVTPEIEKEASQLLQYVTETKRKLPVLYRTIKSFLQFPYQTVAHSLPIADLTNNLTQQYLERWLCKFKTLHKRCGQCQHLQDLMAKIGKNTADKKKIVRIDSIEMQ